MITETQRNCKHEFEGIGEPDFNRPNNDKDGSYAEVRLCVHCCVDEGNWELYLQGVNDGMERLVSTNENLKEGIEKHDNKIRSDTNSKWLARIDDLSPHCSDDDCTQGFEYCREKLKEVK